MARLGRFGFRASSFITHYSLVISHSQRVPKKLLIALGALLALGFLAGFVRLFVLRYEAGEIYPAYSTLRPDPLGAKAIYAALGKVPGVEVRRNLQPLKKMQPGRPVTLV